MTTDHTPQHDPLCRTMRKRDTDPAMCFDCDLIGQLRDHLTQQLNTLAPKCREPSVAVGASNNCTCWAGIHHAIQIIQGATP